MGLAVLSDRENCLAFQGLRCEICYRACPLLGKAISIDFQPQERTGKHAFFLPVVRSEACTGCGMCEHACPLEEAAIKVMPRQLAMGKLGEQLPIRLEGKAGDQPRLRAFRQSAGARSLAGQHQTGARGDGEPLGDRGSMSWLRGHPYLLLRRLSQLGILALFWLGAQQHLGWLTGNLSSSRVLRTIPLVGSLRSAADPGDRPGVRRHGSGRSG